MKRRWQFDSFNTKVARRVKKPGGTYCVLNVRWRGEEFFTNSVVLSALGEELRSTEGMKYSRPGIEVAFV